MMQKRLSQKWRMMRATKFPKQTCLLRARLTQTALGMRRRWKLSIWQVYNYYNTCLECLPSAGIAKMLIKK